MSGVRGDARKRQQGERLTHWDAGVRAVIEREVAKERAVAWESGVRQAIAWLRADYEYGTGPEWRENGAEWIAERLADHTRREAGTK